MIASERSQNIIVAATIVIAIVSSGFLIGNAQYYGGTYILAGRLEFNLVDIRVSNVPPENESISPGISLVFNIAVPAEAEGNVRITFIGATLYLNNDILSLTSFSLTPALSDQYLHSNYNRNVTLSNTASSSADRQTIIDAYFSSTWAWNVTLRCSLIVFDVYGTITWRWHYFYTTDFTLI